MVVDALEVGGDLDVQIGRQPRVFQLVDDADRRGALSNAFSRMIAPS